MTIFQRRKMNKTGICDDLGINRDEKLSCRTFTFEILVSYCMKFDKRS